MFFRVRVDPKDFKRVKTAISKVSSRVLFWSEQLPYKWAKMYSDQVRNNIDVQAFEFQWSGHPYHFRYQQWKKKFTNAGFWELSGALKSALVVKKVKGTPYTSMYFGGLPRGVMGSGLRYGSDNPQEIYYYASMMEWGSTAGGQYHPARPLFRPTHEQLQPKYIEEFNFVVGDIRSQWS